MMRLPDFAPAQSGLRKREAERRKAHAIHCPPRYSSIPSPLAGEGQGGGSEARNRARSPSGAPPRTRKAGRNQRKLSPGPCFPRPDRAGVTRRAPVPVKRAPRGPVLLPAERCPGPPGCGVTSPARGHRGSLRFKDRLEKAIICQLTNYLRHGNILPTKG